jgi:hypothetical protein
LFFAVQTQLLLQNAIHAILGNRVVFLIYRGVASSTAFTTKALRQMRQAKQCESDHQQIFRRNVFRAASTRRLVFFSSHILSGGRSKLGGVAIPPQRRNGSMPGRYQPDSPTGLSFSTAYLRGPEDLSHLRKTLNPGVPVLP